MLRIIHNNHQYTIFLQDKMQDSEYVAFESKDKDSIVNYCDNMLRIDPKDMYEGLDYAEDMDHNVVEYGVTGRFTISYNFLC